MIFGYARVSTADQDTGIQVNELTRAGAERIYEEKVSATSRKGRTELEKLIDNLREDDTLVITRIDRLARSVRDLQEIIDDLRDKGVTLQATQQPIDTGTAAGKAFFDMLGVFSEFETNLRRERQLEGIAKAKAEGRYNGRPRTIDPDQVKTLRDDGIKPAEIAKQLNISRASVYRLL